MQIIYDGWEKMDTEYVTSLSAKRFVKPILHSNENYLFLLKLFKTLFCHGTEII